MYFRERLHLFFDNETLFFRLLPGDDKDLSNILEKKEKDLELVSLELKQAKDTIGKLQMEGKFENDEPNIIKLEHKLKLTDTELNIKEKLLIEAVEKRNFSENKLKKMEDFLESQKTALLEIETKFDNSEKVSKQLLFITKLHPILF